MPLSVCKTEEQFKRWCEEVVEKDRYRIYVTTEENEIILEPKRTTKPLKYCYYKAESIAKAMELAKEISDKYNLPVIEISRMSWDLEKGPAIKIPIEEE